MNVFWICMAVVWGILAAAEFQRYTKNKDKRSLFYACCFLASCILALVAAGIGWFVSSG